MVAILLALAVFSAGTPFAVASRCPFSFCTPKTEAERICEATLAEIRKSPLPPGPRGLRQSLNYLKADGKLRAAARNAGLLEIQKQYGPMFYVPLLPTWLSTTLKKVGVKKAAKYPPGIVLVLDPTLAGKVLSDSKNFRRMYEQASNFLPESILLLQSTTPEEIEKWKVAHSAIVPFLTPSYSAEHYFPSLRSLISEVKDRWVGEAKNGEVRIRNMQAFTREISLRAVTRTLFGIDLDSKTTRLWQSTLDQVATEKDIRDDLALIVDQIITEASASASLRPPNLLDRLLEVQKQENLSGDWVRAQIITLIFAGQETTRSLLDWSTLELARHPEMVERIAEEYEIAVKNPVKLSGPGFLDRFLDETLRLHPVTPNIPRVARETTVLGPYRIPKGTMVFSVLPVVHLLSEVWGTSVGEFDPDRFLEVSPTGKFYPFGAGMRFCPGWALAKLEAKVFLGELATTFKSFSVDGAKIPSYRSRTGAYEMDRPLTIKIKL